MEGLIGLVLPILAQLTPANGGIRHAPRTTADLACVLLAALAAIAATGCLVAALWLWLLPQIGPVAAPVACAVALIFVGSMLVLMGVRFRRRRRTAPSPMLAGRLNDIDVEKFIRAHKSDLLIGALVAGLVLGGFAPQRSRTDRPR